MRWIIDKIWYGNRGISWLFLPFLWPLSLLFGFLSTLRRRRYAAKPALVYRAPVAVVVVGNISAGGNGKTPVVLWLVEQLIAMGSRPGVITRGYGGEAVQYPFLLSTYTATTDAGDEPMLIYQRTGCPVAVSPNRREGVELLLAQGVDIIISDDGLQHYALARDIEIAVIDGTRRFGNGHYLPLGPLRELPARLEIVDFKITNGGRVNHGEIAMNLVASHVINLLNGEHCLANKVGEVVAIAGIGHPKRFFTTLAQLGVTVSQTIAFADHQAFDEKRLRALMLRDTPIIMTEKDMVKCNDFVQRHQITNWWYLPVDAVFAPEDASAILQKIIQCKGKYGSPITRNYCLPKL